MMSGKVWTGDAPQEKCPVAGPPLQGGLDFWNTVVMACDAVTIVEKTGERPTITTKFGNLREYAFGSSAFEVSVVSKNFTKWKVFFSHHPLTFPTYKAMVVVMHVENPTLRLLGFFNRDGGVEWETGTFGPAGADWAVSGSYHLPTCLIRTRDVRLGCVHTRPSLLFFPATPMCTRV